MIAANLPLRCVALEASGSYDTHAGQAAALTPALTTTAASLYAFQRDLEARGIADRVLTLVWSEFGRRAQENGSGGTDHGAAGTAFLIGSRAVGTAVGEFPGLVVARRRRQPEGDVGLPLRLRSLLEQWLRFDAARVIPDAGKFKRYTAGQVKTLASAGSVARSRSAGSTPAPARVQIVAREYSYALSRLHVKAGTAILELDNFGQDPHDLRVQRVGSKHVAELGKVAPGRVRRSDAAPASRAILALVLDREPSQAGHARDADRHALTFDDVGDPAGQPGPLLPRRRRLAPHPAPRRRDRRVARRPPDRRRPLGPGGARPDARHLGARRRGARRLARARAVLGRRLVGRRPARARGRRGAPGARRRASCSSARCRRPTAPASSPATCACRCAPRRSRRGSSRGRLEAWGRKPTPPTGHPDTDAAYLRGRIESFRDGGMWLVRELAVLGRPVGLRRSPTSSAPVTLWWGESDVVCPPSIGRDYEARLPAATLKLVPGTHQVLFPRWRDILADALPG